MTHSDSSNNRVHQVGPATTSTATPTTSWLPTWPPAPDRAGRLAQPGPAGDAQFCRMEDVTRTHKYAKLACRFAISTCQWPERLRPLMARLPAVAGAAQLRQDQLGQDRILGKGVGQHLAEQAASSRRAARTAWEPPREDTVSWVIALLPFARPDEQPLPGTPPRKPGHRPRAVHLAADLPAHHAEDPHAPHLTLTPDRRFRPAASARLARLGGRAQISQIFGPQLDQAYAQRDKLAWTEAAHIAGAPDPVAMVIIAKDDSVGFYDYVLRCPQRAGYIHGDHSARTAGRPISAIVTAVQLGNR
jgi:hypothetical protein